MKYFLMLMVLVVFSYARAENPTGRVGSLNFSDATLAEIEHAGDFSPGYYEKGLKIEGKVFPYRVVEEIPPIHDLLALSAYSNFEKLLGKPMASQGGLNKWTVKETEYKAETWSMVAVKDGDILLLQVLVTFSRPFSDSENDIEWSFSDLACKVCLLKKKSR